MKHCRKPAVLPERISERMAYKKIIQHVKQSGGGKQPEQEWANTESEGGPQFGQFLPWWPREYFEDERESQAHARATSKSFKEQRGPGQRGDSRTDITCDPNPAILRLRRDIKDNTASRMKLKLRIHDGRKQSSEA